LNETVDLHSSVDDHCWLFSHVENSSNEL
jgi:hypothetical protein